MSSYSQLLPWLFFSFFYFSIHEYTFGLGLSVCVTTFTNNNSNNKYVRPGNQTAKRQLFQATLTASSNRILELSWKSIERANEVNGIDLTVFHRL